MFFIVLCIYKWTSINSYHTEGFSV